MHSQASHARQTDHTFTKYNHQFVEGFMIFWMNDSDVDMPAAIDASLDASSVCV